MDTENRTCLLWDAVLNIAATLPKSMPRFLVIDDDASIRTMFSRTLKPMGDVDEADSGMQALKMLMGQKYDIIFLDLHMPVVDGFMILKMLTSKPGPNKETPVFVATADISKEAKVKTLGQPAVCFMRKPVQLSTIAPLVQATLDSSQKKKEREAAKLKDKESKANAKENTVTEGEEESGLFDKAKGFASRLFSKKGNEQKPS